MQVKQRAARRGLLAIAIAMAALAASAQVAADAATIGSSVSIGITAAGNHFAGKVASKTSACNSSRSVVLRRKLAGAASFVTVGTVRTGSTGRWSIATVVNPGARYRADVTRKKVSATRVCAATTSIVVTARAGSVSVVTVLANVHGSVTSPRSACVPKRNVRVTERSVYGSAFASFGKATTGTGGGWTVARSPVPGRTYRATVAARQVGSDACMATSFVRLPRLVYVSTSGSDAASGSAGHPKLSVDAAITAAKAIVPAAVFVATGSYEDTVHLVSGVGVYGGFDSNWQPAVVSTTTLRGVPQAVVAAGVTGARLERLDLEGRPGAGDSSSYAVLAANSKLTLRDVIVSAAAGLDGADGAASAAPPPAAPDGTGGQPGAENSTGLCGTAPQPLGGAGGLAPGVARADAGAMPG